PVLKTGTLHFRLSEPNVRIEADGELAWSDETLKKGGLRFTNLSAETRQQIRHWINQPAMLRTADHRYAPPLPTPRESPSVGASRTSSWATGTEHRRIFALRRLCADPGLPLRRARLAACAKSG